MAFDSASGYNNLPNGNFSPTLFSKKVQTSFRKASVAQMVTNNDYYGEISNQGDTVEIIKEPEIVVDAYVRGQQVDPQDLEDSNFTLIIDQANKFAFQVDDIEKAHSHVNWESISKDRAAYRLADAFDEDVLGYLMGYTKATGSWVARTTSAGIKADANAGADELLADNLIEADAFGGTGGNSVAIGTSGTFTATPLQLISRMKRILDEQNVPRDGRWLTVDPVFLEKLEDEDSKFVSNDYAGGRDAGDLLRNGLVTNQKVRGFSLYSSNNLPTLGTGPDTVDDDGSSANFGVISAGHASSVASAENISKTESFRSTTSFADICRGLHVYGRKILRPEGLVRANYNINA